MSATNATAGRDRRRSERRPYIVEAFISSPTSTDADERWEVTSVDLSRHGIAFDFEEPLPKGAWYVIEIGLGEQRLVSEVRIVSCRPIENGIYHVGAEFC